MENLEKSELVIAKILGLLVEWGFRETQLKFDELGLEEEYRDFFMTCIEWLETEGVIRVREKIKLLDGTATVVGPTLTAHGMVLLGKSLKISGKDMTISAAVKRTAKETGFYTGLGDLGGGFVGGLFKSLGSG